LPIRGRNRRDVADWLAGVDPQERDDLGNQTMLEDLGFTPVTRTRTGRVVRPPVRYSDAEEDRRMRDEKEARDIVRAKRQSMGNVAPAESATRAVARHRANLELIQARKEVAEAEAKYRAEAKRLSMSKSAEKTLTREEADRELAEARREVAEAERLHLREIVEAARLRLAEADAEAEAARNEAEIARDLGMDREELAEARQELARLAAERESWARRHSSDATRAPIATSTPRDPRKSSRTIVPSVNPVPSGANRLSPEPTSEPVAGPSTSSRRTRHDTPPHSGSSHRSSVPPRIEPTAVSIGEPSKASRNRSVVPPASKKSSLPPVSEKSVPKAEDDASKTGKSPSNPPEEPDE
jgi:eukaryotic-like serine/threonine-protein kinase